MSGLTFFLSGVLVTVLCGILVYVTVRELRKAAREHDAYRGKKGTEPSRRPATVLSHSELHVEHREADDEHAAWLTDIAAWRREHDKALPLLARLEAAIQARDRTLGEHAEAIRRHQEQVHHHERHLGERKRAGSLADRGQWIAEHQRQEARHAEERELHQRLAASHRRFMDGLQELVEMLEKG